MLPLSPSDDGAAGTGVSVMASVLPGLSSLSSIVHPSEAMDMPVDPNEPTYCLCHQVSYGEMIACDKMDVSVGCRSGVGVRMSWVGREA